MRLSNCQSARIALLRAGAQLLQSFFYTLLLAIVRNFRAWPLFVVHHELVLHAVQTM